MRFLLGHSSSLSSMSLNGTPQSVGVCKFDKSALQLLLQVFDKIKQDSLSTNPCGYTLVPRQRMTG